MYSLIEMSVGIILKTTDSSSNSRFKQTIKEIIIINFSFTTI
jgi:hypothetical protein